MKGKWISTEDKLPPYNKYVLGIHNRGTWNDSSDNDHVCMVIVKLIKGLSKQDRDDMKNGKMKDELIPVGFSGISTTAPRSSLFSHEDEHGNNKKPYGWDTFGSTNFYGQEISYWMELPNPPESMIKKLRMSIIDKIKEKQINFSNINFNADFKLSESHKDELRKIFKKHNTL